LKIKFPIIPKKKIVTTDKNLIFSNQNFFHITFTLTLKKKTWSKFNSL